MVERSLNMREVQEINNPHRFFYIKINKYLLNIIKVFDIEYKYFIIYLEDIALAYWFKIRFRFIRNEEYKLVV